MLLKDKIALVTGAGRGWGQSIALAYARQGAQVIAISRTPSELDRTAALIQAEGGRVVTMSVDVSQKDAVRRMADKVLSDFGRLDVLVNNAGQLILKTFEELSIEEWDRTIAVNLRGPMLACKFLLPSMKQQGQGSIINVSSMAGVKGFVKETAYCASKFGLEGLSQSLAMEVQQYNIAVNTVAPGGASAGVRMKPTSLTQAEFDTLSELERAQWTDSILYTEALIFLALQDGHGVTGQRILAYELSERIRREGWNIEYGPLA
jgi:NAD(P)-dependent dehydrogenase (short-subunit alcohol dehydrogenase family)